MFSAEMIRMLNTLYGFIGNGEVLCNKCAEKQGYRDDHGLTREGADEGYRPLTGTDYFNAGEDAEDDTRCCDCGTLNPETHKLPDIEGGEVWHVTNCCNENVVAAHTCDDCGEPLADSKEE